MADLVSGISWQKFNCHSDQCNIDENETVPAIPLELQTSFIITDKIAVGFNFYHMFNTRTTLSGEPDISGVAFGIKFGTLR